MKLFSRNKGKEQEEKEARLSKKKVGDFPFLTEIKPKEAYVFHSDYFQVDDYYGTILAYFHRQGVNDNFGPFWPINMIPRGLPENVSTVNLDQYRRQGEGWIREHQRSAEGVTEMNQNSQNASGNHTTRRKAEKASQDMQIIAQELIGGASYLIVQNRLLVKAPTLKELDDAVDKITRDYVKLFETVWAAPYSGEQRQELGHLFAPNALKRGRGFGFTSTEAAGMYNLVTHGMEDPDGEYVGYMVEDVNNSAVLFNPDRFSHHVVVASEQFDEKRNRAHMADLWGSKISQSCMCDGHRVVHLILDDANLDKLGPEFKASTSKINMDHGDLNMFEMFGDPEDELSVFPAQLEKLKLMTEQMYPPTDQERAMISGVVGEIATQFYIDSRMWYENAKENRNRLRVVGLPHDEVPRLEKFVAYLDKERKAVLTNQAADQERIHAVNVVRNTFRELLATNGDLFNTKTSDEIDNAVNGRRVIYDFSKLAARGSGVAMAQLVNVIGYAVQSLRENDTMIIHGADLIDSRVQDYVGKQCQKLYRRGAKVVFLYNSLEKMIDDQPFNRFDEADYTILGSMSENMAEKYQDTLKQAIPANLISLITTKSDSRVYLRRGFENVVFVQDLQLDIPQPADATRHQAKRKERSRESGNK